MVDFPEVACDEGLERETRILGGRDQVLKSLSRSLLGPFADGQRSIGQPPDPCARELCSSRLSHPQAARSACVSVCSSVSESSSGWPWTPSPLLPLFQVSSFLCTQTLCPFPHQFR